jgi:hypothetical protein
VVTAGRTAPACSSPGSMQGQRGKLHSVLEEGLGGGISPGAGGRRSPGRRLAMAGGGARLGVRRQRARLASFGL